MKLGGYAASRQVRVPVWVAVLLGLIWGGRVWVDFYNAPTVEGEGAEEVYLLYADREMRMLDGGREGPALMQWVLEVKDRKKVVRELLRSFEAAAEGGILGEEGALVHATLHWELGERAKARDALGDAADAQEVSFDVLRQALDDDNEPVAAGDLAVLREMVASGGIDAWDAWILRLASGGEAAGAPDIWAVYDENSFTLARRVFLMTVVITIPVLAGLVCVPLVVIGWLKRPVPRVHPVVCLWSAPLVFSVFFWAELVGDFSLSVLGGTLALVDEWPTVVWAAYDTIWRVLPVGVVVLFLFNRPRHILRVFGMVRARFWVSALGMLGLIWSWDLLVSLVGEEHLAPVQPTDYLQSVDLGAGGVALAFWSTCVVAPVVEETMFRGLLFLGLRRSLGPWGALAVSSIFFGLIHWQYDPFGVASVMLLGAANGVLVWRTGSLFPAILVHALYNLLIMGHVFVAYQWSW